MAGKLVGWGFEEPCGCPIRKLVVVKLCDQANDEGYSWPSIAKLMADTELGQSTIYRKLAELVELGTITPKTIFVEFKDNPGQKFEVDGYKINAPESVLRIPAAGKTGTRAGSRRGKGDSRCGKEIPAAGIKIPAAGNGIPAGGITLIEPPTEPSTNLPPARACGPKGRALGLDRMVVNFRAEVSEPMWDRWLADARFNVGPPVTILVRPDVLSIVRSHLGEKARSVFGRDVVFAPLAGNATQGDADAQSQPTNDSA